MNQGLREFVLGASPGPGTVVKIGVVSDNYYPCPSGIAQHADGLAHGLRELGHEVKILTTNHSRCDTSTESLKRIGRAFPIPFNGSVFYMAVDRNLAIRVRDYLRREQFDLLWLMAMFPPNLAFWALHYSRATNIARFTSTGFTGRAPFSFLVRNISTRYRRKIHGFNVPSASARDAVAPYLPGEYRIIPDAVDTDRFSPRVPPAPGFASQGPKILYVGRHDPRKGLRQLLLAFPVVRQSVPDATLLVVGKGPLENRNHRLASDLGIADSVRFLGFVSNDLLPSLYAACDVYCSPALGGESFGIVLLEAMATGRPVVASDIVGYRQVVRDGYNGLLADPNDPADMADALVRVLTNPGLKESLSANGRRFALEHSWPVIAATAERFCREVSAARNGRRR